MPPITVVIADRDKRRLRVCMRLLHGVRGIKIIATANTGRESVVTAEHRPQILLLDLNLATSYEAATVPLIRTKSPGTHIILLAGRASDSLVLEGISHGARGYLEAKMLRRFLVKAVRAVAAGESWVSRAMVAKLIDRLARLMAHQGRPRRA